MNDKVYIRFNNPKGKTSPRPGQLKKKIKNAIEKILSTIIPKANPDFEHLLDEVDYWKIEYNKNEDITDREIGFDKNGISIVAMPLRNNYGYWTDNHLTLDDYNKFDPTPISANEFDNNWTEFEKNK